MKNADKRAVAKDKKEGDYFLFDCPHCGNEHTLHDSVFSPYNRVVTCFQCRLPFTACQRTPLNLALYDNPDFS